MFLFCHKEQSDNTIIKNVNIIIKQAGLETNFRDMLVVLQEQENREMLERFRMAHSDAEEQEVKLQQVEGLNNSIKLELLSSDTERRHLRERVSLQDREIQEVWL